MLPKITLIKTTLKEASMDNNTGEGLVDSEELVYHFDEIKNGVSAKLRLGKQNSSVDALIVKNDLIWFIEFKNANDRTVKQLYKACLHEKAFDSLMTYQTAFDTKISLDELTSKSIYVVVYNNTKGVLTTDSKPSKTTSAIVVAMKGFKNKPPQGNREIQFGLNKLEGVLYKEVYTLDVKEFENVLLPKLI